MILKSNPAVVIAVMADFLLFLKRATAISSCKTRTGSGDWIAYFERRHVSWVKPGREFIRQDHLPERSVAGWLINWSRIFLAWSCIFSILHRLQPVCYQDSESALAFSVIYLIRHLHVL